MQATRFTRPQVQSLPKLSLPCLPNLLTRQSAEACVLTSKVLSGAARGVVSQASQCARGSVALHSRFMAITDACTEASLPADTRDYLLCGSLCIGVSQEQLRRCGGAAPLLNMDCCHVFWPLHLRLTHGNSLKQPAWAGRHRTRARHDGPHGLAWWRRKQLDASPEHSMLLSTHEWWRSQQHRRRVLDACGSAERAAGTRSVRNDAANIFRGFVASAGRVQPCCTEQFCRPIRSLGRTL